MAFQLLNSFPTSTTLTRFPSTTLTSPRNLSCNKLHSLPFQVRCTTATKTTNQTVVRRSGNYQTAAWAPDFIQSLTSEYVGEPYRERASKLKAEVRMKIEKTLKPVDKLELIDDLQRLGLAYHFEDEIKSILKNIFNDIHNHTEDTKTEADLYASALEFRLLRQHGYRAPQEVFNQFKDEHGNFRASLCDDLKGMLYLYEASYFSAEGESILDDARDFTSKNLEIQCFKKCNDISTEYLSKLATHALEVPLAWRMQRWETYWFIHAYESKPDMEPIVLEFATLDFNMVQAIHQEDLKYTFRWWTEIGIAEKLDFARNWLVETFLGSTGFIFEPHYAYGRRVQTKITNLIAVLDDVYDVYGTVDELQLFTDAVTRWDIKAIDELPYYMKVCFYGLYNTIHDIAFDALKDSGVHILPCLKKVWADYFKAVLVEAKWYHTGYTPTLQEYLDNGYISAAAPLLILHGYLGIIKPLTTEALQSLEEHFDLLRCASVFVRLTDDLGTATGELRRGDVPKAVQCYMNETGATEEKARNHIIYLTSETWKKMNGIRFANPSFSQTLVEVAFNVARTSHCTFRHGDEYDVALIEAKKTVKSLFIEPISLS